MCSTLVPPENTRTLPSVAETTTAVEVVRFVTAAAATCHAPRPAGSDILIFGEVKKVPAV